MIQLPRLDILLYAHDGRGLGHASRTIAIGMALRRLYPQLRVLFVSGCHMSQELIDTAPLDWLKLPAYRTEVVDGQSRGLDGLSGFTDKELAGLRRRALADIVALYRPRLILCDHSPQGKHRELEAALAAGEKDGIIWVLGLRAIVGGVRQVLADSARRLFAEHYRALLWYGDSRLLGQQPVEQLAELYGSAPIVCGYVARLSELGHWRQPPGRDAGLAGTLAIPWLGEYSLPFLRTLARALAEIDPGLGDWQLFVEPAGDAAIQTEIISLFTELPQCHLEPPSGRRYAEALLNSRMAMVYGGYNSLIDVLAAQLPALVVLRPMRDEEQELHLQALLAAVPGRFQLIREDQVNPEQLRQALEAAEQEGPCPAAVRLDGAATAARALFDLLVESSGPA